MKRSTIALTTAAAVVLGGAAVGGYALTTNPEPTETPAAVSTVTPSETPETTPEATPSAEPTPEYTDAEATYISYRYSRPDIFGPVSYQTDAEFLASGYEVCEQANEGVPYDDIYVYPDEWSISSTVRREAPILLCPEVYEANVGPLD